MTLGKTAEWVCPVPVPGCISALNDCLGGRDNDQVLGATSVQDFASTRRKDLSCSYSPERVRLLSQVLASYEESSA